MQSSGERTGFATSASLKAWMICSTHCSGDSNNWFVDVAVEECGFDVGEAENDDRGKKITRIYKMTLEQEHK